MIFTETDIPDVWIIEPKVFEDARGYFMETFRQSEFERYVGCADFVQDNESCSAQGVLRGLHYQLMPFSQAKLVRVIEGRALDVAVDIRCGSPTFGRTVTVELSSENKRQLFIPHGFAHGFRVLSRRVIFTYKVDTPYMPAYERGIRFDDPTLGIDWKFAEGEQPVISEKDGKHPLLHEAEINFEYNRGGAG